MVQRKVYFDKKRKKYYIKKFRKVRGKRKLVKVFLTTEQLKALRLKRVRRFRKSSAKKGKPKLRKSEIYLRRVKNSRTLMPFEK